MHAGKYHLSCDFCYTVLHVRLRNTFIQETVYHISSASLEFCRIYYEKHFGLFFLAAVIYSMLINQKVTST